MAIQVCMGAQMTCSFGATPSALIVARPDTMTSSMPAATIMDCVPIENIPPFGMCSAPTNPAVIAATAAKLGVFTPVPCVPVTTPWIPAAPTSMIGGLPVLTNDATCLCSWLGVITFVQAGQVPHAVG